MAADRRHRGRRQPGLSSALIALLAWLFLAGDLRAQTTPPNLTGARIIGLTGELSLRRLREQPRVLKLNDEVQPGDELITGPSAEAVIQARDGSTVRIFPDSRIIFSEHSPDIQEFLHLFFGSIKVHIEKLSGRPNPHQMTTPSAVIAVRGTTFSVFVDDTDATLVAVDEGLVGVANRRAPSEEVLLHGGQRTWVRGDQPPLRAQRFRGRSEQADLIPGPGAGQAMGSRGMNGAAMGGHMDPTAGGSVAGMAGMGGPHH